MTLPPHRRGCPGVTRRQFLADTGMGFTELALAAMLHQDGVARADHTPRDGRPHFEPRAKSVILIFLCGGVSHVESFDVKPDLYARRGCQIRQGGGTWPGGQITRPKRRNALLRYWLRKLTNMANALR